MGFGLLSFESIVETLWHLTTESEERSVVGLSFHTQALIPIPIRFTPIGVYNTSVGGGKSSDFFHFSIGGIALLPLR